MNNEQLIIGEGVTESIPIALVSVDRQTGVETVINLTGATLLTLNIRSEDEVTIIRYNTTTDPNNISFPVDRTTGIVTFTPLGTEFVYTDRFYYAYFMLTDSTGELIRIPTEGFFQIVVLEAF